MATVTKEKFTSGVIWKLGEQFGPSIVSLILSMVLARILSPEDYSIIAIANVFIAFSDILVQSGFCESLIQKKDVDKNDYSTATSISMMIATVLYIVVFFTSPYIAKFYDMPDLDRILKVLGVLVFVNGLSAVMNAYIVRNFKFRLLFVVHMASSLISAVVGIASAYSGCGVWALVIQKLVQQGVFLIVLAIVLKWRFVPRLSKSSAKSLIKYGANILGGAIIAFVSDNSYSVAIGRTYPEASVGYLSKADQLPQALIISSSSSLSSVTLPTMVSIRENGKDAVCAAYRKIMKTISYIIFPLIVGMFAVADNLITVLFTDKFIACVPLLRALCLFYITVPFLMSANAAIKAMGKSKIYILSELLKMVMTVSLVAAFCFAVTIELHWLVLIKGCISVFMCAWTLVFTKRYFGYGPLKHIIDIFPAVLLSAVMGVCAYAIGLPMRSISPIVGLIVQVVTGVAVYIGLSLIATKFWKFTGFTNAWGILKSMFSKLKRAKNDGVVAEVSGVAENTVVGETVATEAENIVVTSDATDAADSTDDTRSADPLMSIDENEKQLSDDGADHLQGGGDE